MTIGVDFDNTIVSYDRLFHRLACDQALIPASTPATKTAVRDHLRATGREPVWTALQGTVYGSRMAEADPFPGVQAFFRMCRRAGIPVRIISHKTRHPFLGESHDLHAAARRWLEQHGFFMAEGGGMRPEDVFFELTKPEKLARIAACGCDAFIDDLPEIFSDPLFPPGVTRFLFDPGCIHLAADGMKRHATWADLTTHLEKAGSDDTALRRDLAAAGGANNRVRVVDGAAGGRFIRKEYFTHPEDPRDRFRTERDFYTYAWNIAGVRSLPQPFAWEDAGRSGLFELVAGRQLTAAEIDEAAIAAAIRFIADLNSARESAAARALGDASEACFSTHQHLATVDRRIARLADADLTGEARDYVQQDLSPAWTTIRAEASRQLARAGDETAPLPFAERCVSPSDFGFHNALRRQDGQLVFFDFEYAGWDDPAKLVCDFFCQPGVPVPGEWRERFAHGIAEALQLPAPDDLLGRCHALLPVYQIKWCTIMLNEFVPSSRARRAFAIGPGEMEQRQASQLRKARTALDHILASAQL